MNQADDRAPKIHLATAGRFHVLELAREYEKLSRLGSVEVVAKPGKRPAVIPPSKYHNHILLAASILAKERIGIGLKRQAVSEHVDRLVLKRLKGLEPGILHGWNTHMHSTFRGLRNTGWLRCVERSCPHNQWQHDLLVEEAGLIGMPLPLSSPSIGLAIEELYEADIIIAPSTYSFSSYGDPELRRKVRINPLGSNLPIRPLRQGFNAKSLNALMIGNFFLRKGTHWLIEAWKQIEIPGKSLTIRGDVPNGYRAKIGDPTITILPPVSRSKILELYAKADVFVLPSIDEGFGLVVFEALSFGLPVVTTKNVGSAELLNDSISRVVPIRDPNSLANAIIEAKALRLHSDAFDRERKRVLTEWSWESCAKRMLQDVYVF